LPIGSVSSASLFVPEITISRNRRSTRQLSAFNTPNSKNIPKTKKLNPIWRKGNVSQNPVFIQFFGEKPIPNALKEMTSPKNYFSYFFDYLLLVHIYYISYIAEQSTLYRTQQNPENPNKITINNVRHFLRIITMMSLHLYIL